MTKVISFPQTKSPKSPASAEALWRNVDRIRIALDLPAERLRDYLGMTLTEIDAAKRMGASPSISALQKLCTSVGLTLEALMTGTMDLKALARHNAGDARYLPERYAVGAFSRRSTAENLLNYVEHKFGYEKRAKLLKRFQLTEAHFSDPSEWINIRFTLDASTHLYQSHLSTYLLREMGHHSAKTHWHSGLGESLRQEQSLRRVYELFANTLCSAYLERNYTWEIEEIGSGHCFISGRPSEELIDAIGRNEASSGILCHIRKGIIESVPLYLNLPPANVTKICCVGQGDPTCVFHVDYSTSVFRGYKGFEQATAN